VNRLKWGFCALALMWAGCAGGEMDTAPTDQNEPGAYTPEGDHESGTNPEGDPDHEEPTEPDTHEPDGEIGQPEVQHDLDEEGCSVAPITQEESQRHGGIAVQGPGGPPLTIFLNRHGGTYRAGANDSSRNRSSIISGTRTIPAYERGDASWNDLLQCVREQFAAFNLFVTDVEPGSGNYVEAVVGGWPGNIGQGGGIAGIAPVDYYACRPIEQAVAYVFTRNIGSDRRVCELAAHEIGHTLSLEHEYKCQDPMTYLSGCGQKVFQDSSEWCGTGRAVQCQCRGGRQNTVQALLSLVGPASGDPPPSPDDDEAAPVVEILAPDDGVTRQERTTLTVQARATDDQWLSRVELHWDYNGEVYTCPTDVDFVTCDLSDQGVATWNIEVSTGQRTYRVRAVDFMGKEATTPSRTITLTSTGEPEPEPEPETVDAVAPTITGLSPPDGAVRAPGTQIVVEAEVQDDVALDQVQLQWDFNGQNYACPPVPASEHVTCSVDGSTYRWLVSVGVEDARPFRVRALDTSGNESVSETRTVDVREVQDETAPTVEIVEPAVDTQWAARTQLRVVVDAADDTDVAAVELIWDFNGMNYGCPRDGTYVDCTVEGSTYTWLIDVGTGTRTWRIKASDTAGNEVVTPDRTYELAP
jgi:hypothetical protein